MKKTFKRCNLRLTLDSKLPLTKELKDDKRAIVDFLCNGDVLASCNYWQAICGGSVGKFALLDNDLVWLNSFESVLTVFLNYNLTEYRK